MHVHLLYPFRRKRGMTFLEISIVISVLMGLIMMLFVGVRSWKMGSDRASCILNQRSMQMAVRSYQNMYGIQNNAPPGGGTVIDVLLASEFISAHLHSCASGATECPGGGIYSMADPGNFPDDGVLFMTCSLSESEKHEPENHADW